MPEWTVLMTLVLRSPETRQNTARAPGNSPAQNVCTHVHVLQQATPSLPQAHQAEPPAACGQAAPLRFQVPTQSNGEAATHTALTPKLQKPLQMWVPGVDPSTSEFSEFPAYWRVKLDSRSQLPACGKRLRAGSGGYGAQRTKDDGCGCREIYSSNTDFVVVKFRLGICIWKFFMKVLSLTTSIALLRDYSS